MLDSDARELPRFIHKNALSEFNAPASIKFDRIEVSNILDPNYVGLRDVLTLWGPLLVESRSAAIVGYFMNWPAVQQDGRASWTKDSDVMENLVQRVMEKEKLELKGTMPDLVDTHTMFHSSMKGVEAFHENSEPFFWFLQSQGLDDLLGKTRLRLRKKHAIVPHRILAPLGGSPSALPEFPDDDAWYHYTKLSCFTWSEHFVEFEHNGSTVTQRNFGYYFLYLGVAIAIIIVMLHTFFLLPPLL